MATCRWCYEEMTTSVSCSVESMHREGVPVAMVRWGNERRWRARGRCGDCGVALGGFHHLGCDIQQCALCGGQMITCGCRFDEDASDGDDDDWGDDA